MTSYVKTQPNPYKNTGWLYSTTWMMAILGAEDLSLLIVQSERWLESTNPGNFSGYNQLKVKELFKY